MAAFLCLTKPACINWPQGAEADDGLKFLKEKNTRPHLSLTDDRHAQTTEAVEQMDLVVSAMDYGAWGTLRVTATDEDGNDVAVKVLGKETPDLAIPLDDNGNRIADAWEAARGVKGYPATWDDAEVPGQKSRGDGLSLYEEYRGVVFMDGNDAAWTRLEPKDKVLFVIDEGGVFDAAAWKKASQITAYKLRADMAQAAGGNKTASRVVNTNTTECRVGRKTALVIHLSKDVKRLGSDGMELGETSTNDDNPPQKVTYCEVYAGSIQLWVLNMAKGLEKAVADKSSPEARGYDKAGIPPWLRERALKQLQAPGGASQMVRQLTRWTAIHEAGHACGIPGHLVSPTSEGAIGYRRCYMCYSTSMQDMQYLVLQTFISAGSPMPAFSGVFCKKGDRNEFDWKDEKGRSHSPKDWPAAWEFDCFSHLNVKDGM